MYFIISHIDGNATSSLFVNNQFRELQSSLKCKNVEYYITCNGKLVDSTENLEDDHIYHIIPKLPGGKGGFGSMLRAIGAQIDKTNNREACRDLSGRRMRDVNNEKQLKDWIAKKAEKEKEREEKKRERMERRRAMPNHKFDDPLYDSQKAVVTENLEDALQTGLMRTQSKSKASSTVTSEEEAVASCSGVKRKSNGNSDGPQAKVKKHTEWLGIDIDNLSDLDSDDDDSKHSSSDKSDEICESNDRKDCSDSAACSDYFQSEDHSFVTNNNSDMKTISESSNVDKSLTNSENIKEEMAAEDKESASAEDKGSNFSEDKRGSLIDGQDAKVNTGITSQEDRSTESLPIQEKKEFDFVDCSSAADMETLGLEKLKSLLMERGLKCGGTLQERAERLFSVKGLKPEEIDPSLFAKPNNKGKRK